MTRQNGSERAISLLEQKLKELVELISKKVFRSYDDYASYFGKWCSETEYILKQIFGEDSREFRKFENALKLPFGPAIENSDQRDRRIPKDRHMAMKKAETEIQAILFAIEEYGIPEKQEDAIPPKAFIAHEGETRALTILKEFLEALGIQYFIAESKASDGRSIEKQVDWTQSEADFAVCLATKGKAINKKTGKHYMAPNIIDELGRARQVFGNKIILLVQKGVEVHTNVGEIVHETFTTTNMERAFIKITKELRNWGFIREGKPKE